MMIGPVQKTLTTPRNNWSPVSYHHTRPKEASPHARKQSVVRRLFFSRNTATYSSIHNSNAPSSRCFHNNSRMSASARLSLDGDCSTRSKSCLTKCVTTNDLQVRSLPPTTPSVASIILLDSCWIPRTGPKGAPPESTHLDGEGIILSYNAVVGFYLYSWLPLQIK